MPGPVTARRYLHHAAKHLHWPDMPPVVHECEPHLPRLAKNWVAFFSISLSSLRIRFSKRRRSFSRAKSACGADTRSVGRYCDIHLPSVDNPTPRSAATRRRYKSRETSLSLGTHRPTLCGLDAHHRIRPMDHEQGRACPLRPSFKAAQTPFSNC